MKSKKEIIPKIRSMKKFVLAVLCGIAALNLSAQDWSFGPKAGINISNFTNADDSKSLTGLNAGGFIVYSIVENFGVSAEVLYSGEGAKYTYTTTEDNATVKTEDKLRLNYVRIPLLWNIFFGHLGDNIRPKIFLGPSFGLLTGVENSMTITTTDNGYTTTSETKNHDKSGIASFDLSAIFGAGLNFKLGEKMWLNFDARYSIGATDINEVKQDKAIENNGFSGSLGLAFGLK